MQWGSDDQRGSQAGEPATDSAEQVTGAGELSTEIVYARLRDSILHGGFDPGVPISQVRLAAEMGVSRTPLREALRMLQRDGLIDSEPNRKVRISPLTIAELEQFYAARILVECLTARLAAAALSSAGVAQMRRLLREMAALAGQDDFDSWDIRHRAFHELLKKPGRRPAGHDRQGPVRSHRALPSRLPRRTAGMGHGGAGPHGHLRRLRSR